MAKGLRSKIKKHFRTVKRETLTNTETYKERERKRQQHLEEIVNAPKPEPPPNAVAAVDVDDEEGRSNMEEEDGLPELTTQNPARLARKLKARRLAKQKGVVQGVKKKVNPLAGANQFHKKKKRR